MAFASIPMRISNSAATDLILVPCLKFVLLHRDEASPRKLAGQTVMSEVSFMKN
jgi:hypothetical protein